MTRPLTLKDIAAFFVPLALTSELLFISQSMILAAMARWPDPTVSLAAFNVLFSFHTILSSPTAVAPSTILAYLRGRGALVELVLFHAKVMVAPMLVMLCVAATPVGSWVFGRVLGAGDAVTAEARHAAYVFAMVHPFIALRGLAQAVFMRERRTFAITLGTAVRLGGLVGVLALVSHWVTGAVGGALSLLISVTIETALMLFLARAHLRALPRSEEEVRPTQREMWHFAWPLMLSQITDGALAFIINIFIGRLVLADLAQATYGVVRNQAMLLLSPLRSLATTAQALTRTSGEQALMIRFAGMCVVVISTLILVLYWTPLRVVILRGLMGLTTDMSDYSTPGVQAMLFVPLFWGAGAVFRGLLSARRQTGTIGLSSALKMAAVVATASVTLFRPDANGTLVGIWALAAAFGVESVVLGADLLRRRR
jgi:Na+-driven multidrug efflux pump